MSEKAEDINYCPNCGEGNVSIIGQAESGEWVLRCHDCDLDWAIRNVTGHVKIKIILKCDIPGHKPGFEPGE